MVNKNKKILIIDDDKVFLETMTAVLKLSDFKVFGEQSGEKGLKAVEDIEPDLVLLDVNLPDKSGLDVLESIRKSKNFADLPVFLITGDTAVDVDKAFDSGADDCLFKPINSGDAIKRIKKVLGK